MADGIDEFTLLCESCGYPLTGLSMDGRCPECGRPIAESVPDRRHGSSWQKHPSPQSWLTTNARAVLHTTSHFHAVRIERRRSIGLLSANLAVTAFFIAAVPALGDADYGFRQGFGLTRGAIPTFLIASIPYAIIVWAVLFMLTSIELAGVQFFGRRSAWRITPTIAWAVCSHASTGWLLAGVLVLFARLFLASPARLPWMGPWTDLFGTVWPGIGFFLGLLLFETLVYIGIRRCRFANRMPPVPDA